MVILNDPVIEHNQRFTSVKIRFRARARATGHGIIERRGRDDWLKRFLLLFFSF